MLGTLQSDMTRQGVSTTKKGECAACNKPIIGQVCTALGRTWHPEHFTCVTCEVPLGAANFFERDGRPFCERDYHEQFAPRCAYCSGPILDVSFLFSCLKACAYRIQTFESVYKIVWCDHSNEILALQRFIPVDILQVKFDFRLKIFLPRLILNIWFVY